MADLALTDRQRLDWLRLIRSENVGPQTFRTLLKRYGGATAALDALPELARKAGRHLTLCPQAEAEREIEALGRMGARLLALGEPGYPVALQVIDSAPPLIALLGRAEAILAPAVAIVGSRNASAAGMKFTERLARELGAAGFTVVSGLARGIDTAAHRASLDTGTIAVLAGGLDRVYPPENEPLFARLLERGAAVAEMPLGYVARGRDFPRRNRVVSGLSLATIVVEAARRSGSLITARFANEQGRLVFAVPGSPLDPRAEGGNHLIREGATLCADPSHVIEALEPLLRRPELSFPPPGVREEADAARPAPLWDELDFAQAAPAPSLPLPAADWGESASEPAGGPSLLSLLATVPVSLDDLVRATGSPVRDVSRALVELELAGAVLRHPGGGFSRARG